MSQLQIFNFESNQVRVSLVNSEPFWCALDVCRVLGYSNGRDAIARHCKARGVVKHDTPTISGIQQLSYINESNLYRLIAKSNLPAAEKFESWIFEEVLPSIRKTGSYSVPMPLTYPEALRAYAAEYEAKEAAVKLLTAQQPKVELAEQCLIAENTRSMSETAKCLGTGLIKLFEALREKSIIMKKPSTLPYQQYIDNGCFEVILVSKNQKENVVNYSAARVTPKGLDFIRKTLKKEVKIS